MKLTLPPPPRGFPSEDCRKRNTCIAEAGWRLRCQLAQRARAGEVPPSRPVIVAITAPRLLGCAFDAHAGPAIDLLCRHGVIVSVGDISGISLVWHELETIEVSLEPAALRNGAGA